MTRRNPLPRSTPESQGVPSASILAFVAAAEAGIENLHSLMLLRHGRVIAEGWWEPYAAELPHMMFSLSKSFTSTAVGLAIAEGLFGLDTRVVDLLPDDLPAEIGPRLAALRVRHLLTMTTGHASESLTRADRAEHDDWARLILGEPIEFEPGSHFVYNSGASYLLSAIVQRVSGRSVLDYLAPRVLAPLGIEGATWETCPRGIDTGGWGLSIRTEDVAAFGQLFLQGGRWDGRQLVPAEWVAEATSQRVPNGDPSEPSDWSQGYGYQFWRCRNGAYRGDGAFGQFCIVMPEQDAVLVMTGGLLDMQVPLDLAWSLLLPALSGTVPLAEPAGGEPAPLSSLAFAPQAGAASSPTARRVLGVEYAFPNGTVILRSSETGASVALTIDDVEREIALGTGRWVSGETLPFDEASSGAVAASGAWIDDDSYVALLCFRETPFIETLTLTFGDDDVTIDLAQNVSFGDTRLLHVTGRRT